MKRYNLKYCCDDVSVFPSSTLINHDNNKFSEYFGLTAISTYQLKNKEPNEEPKKKGKIYLFGLNQNIKDDDNNNCEIDYYLEYKKNINFHNGVLQSNYIFTNDKLYLGSVCVNGFYLSDLKEETYEKLLETSKEKNNSGLSFEAFDNKPEKICISFSNGDMCLLVHGQQEKTWKAHEYHVWSCTFNGNENVITTGSDDCSFVIWDLRTTTISQQNKKSHTQGITAVKFENFSELLYTASYDNNIRIFDLRNIREPIQTVDVNSSIWRIKFLYKNNSVDNLLVAACDGGAKIFKKSNNDFIYDKGIFNNNELTYGIDVIDMLRPKNEKKKIYLSCSFYNKEVQLWD
ncbi:conserved protein, unknown function [Plasmodium sp. gorilla clade G1]|nr:conserved protein, unknown function [Plasmodium sp. gorilla clade G1]